MKGRQRRKEAKRAVRRDISPKNDPAARERASAGQSVERFMWGTYSSRGRDRAHGALGTHESNLAPVWLLLPCTRPPLSHYHRCRCRCCGAFGQQQAPAAAAAGLCPPYHQAHLAARASSPAWQPRHPHPAASANTSTAAAAAAAARWRAPHLRQIILSWLYLRARICRLGSMMPPRRRSTRCSVDSFWML